jgi:hypothetical protein
MQLITSVKENAKTILRVEEGHNRAASNNRASEVLVAAVAIVPTSGRVAARVMVAREVAMDAEISVVVDHLCLKKSLQKKKYRIK